MIATELAGVVAEHIAAVNALDTDAVVTTFAEDAYVNDARREFAGIEAITAATPAKIAFAGRSRSVRVRWHRDHHRGHARKNRFRRQVAFGAVGGGMGSGR